MENEVLQNWVFHFNPFNDTWTAIHRDDYLEYWNNGQSKKTIKSSNIKTLVELINRTGGDLKEINKLTRKKVSRETGK